MPMPKTLREHLEDGTLGPLRTRAQAEAEEQGACPICTDAERRYEDLLSTMESREPFAWWLIGGTDVFLASEYTPDTEHRDEWCPLFR